MAVRLGNMQALATYDTARFADTAAAGTIPVAVGLSMTLPGLPVVFMSDEFGLLGADGELSRTPLPWGTEDDTGRAERIALYQDLVSLRRAPPVLADGGPRWLHVDEAAVAFARESAAETVLVVACREDLSFELPREALLAAWALPGVTVLSSVTDVAETARESALSAV